MKKPGAAPSNRDEYLAKMEISASLLRHAERIGTFM
jgi:hypothetical protein